MTATWAGALQLAGLALELTGVLRMANGYTRAIHGRSVVPLLLRALMRDPAIREAERFRAFTTEDHAIVLQGLALIAVGFVLQSAGVLLAHFFR